MDVELQHPITRAISELVKGIAHNYAALRIDESLTDSRLTITVTPHSSDYPLLCGSGGRHVRALKYITVRACAVANLSGNFILNEAFEGQWQASEKSGNFDMERFKRLLFTINELCFRNPVGLVEIRESGVDRRKIKVILAPSNPEEGDSTTIAAMNSAFYPYGAKSGVVLDITKVK